MAVIDVSELREPVKDPNKVKKVKYPNMKMLCEFDANLVPADSVRIAGIRDYSLCDGPGIRRVVYFQGCYHKCKGCHNPETWATDGGTIIAISDIFKDLPPMTTGITFSGGEPAYQLDALVKAMGMAKFMGLDVCVYTGAILSEWQLLTFLNPDMIPLYDYVKIGPYVEELRDLSLAYRGSSNQKLYKNDGGELNEVIPEWGLVYRKVDTRECIVTKVD